MVAPTNRAIGRGSSSSSVPEPDEEDDPEMQEDLESFRAWLITQSNSKVGGKTAVVQKPPAEPASEPAPAAAPVAAPAAALAPSPSIPCESCSKDPCKLNQFT